MGQLLSVPILADTVVQETGIDRHPKTFLECFIDGKLDTQRYLQYNKRSYEEDCTQIADLLFGKSLLQVEYDEQDADLYQQDVQQRHVNKKRRKQKQVVMYTDTATGTRHRLLPTMSIW
jgi:hypothetical protein